MSDLALPLLAREMFEREDYAFVMGGVRAAGENSDCGEEWRNTALLDSRMVADLACSLDEAQANGHEGTWYISRNSYVRLHDVVRPRYQGTCLR